MTETATISVHDFVAVVRRSTLVDEEKLRRVLKGVDLPRVQAEDVAQLLLEAKLLTAWHVRQLLKGRYRGYRLGKYRLLSELGRGGMAKVFLARHETLRNLVAIKVLARERLAKPSMIHRFLREARAAAQLSHPNIVRVFDVDADDDRHYLVMEYVRGRSVQEMVDDDGPLSYERAVRFTYEAALGLAAAHRHGLIHRDVKPANLLVEDDRLVKLSDFGLALAGGEEDDETPSLTMQHDEKVLGTADYIAPEQAINSHTIDARADQYSLGYTLYFMLTGQPPFPTGRIVERLTKHCTQEPPSISMFRHDVPQSLLAIVQKLTRKEAVERFPTTEAAAAALAQWLANAAHAVETSPLMHSAALRPSVKSSAIAPCATSSTLGDDDELSLAPDDDDRSAASRGESHEKARLPTLSASDLLDETEGDDDGLPRLLDDTLDGMLDATAATSASGIRSAEGARGSSDVHGSDVRQRPASRVDTVASRAMPTSPCERPAPRVSLFERLQGRMQRGDYPLWLLIGAGLILGAIAIGVAVSYVDFSKSAQPPAARPDYRRFEQ